MTDIDREGKIRPLGRPDLDAVLRLWDAATVRGESTYGPKPPALDEAASMLLDGPPRFESYVYETSDGIVGWSGLLRYHEREAYGATAELVAYVAPDRRRQGVGRRLSHHALARAPELGFHTIVVILQPEPAYLLAVAARLGFRCTGRLTSVLAVGSEWRDIFIFQRPAAAPERGAR
jgi:L-amino acid N-acyltransferase YncA